MILREPASDRALGSITLHPHQLSAVERLVPAIDQFNGALLCDEVGMGKTYVALAIARRFDRCLVVAPAALIAMWRAALTASSTEADFISFESLSRADANDRGRTAEHRASYDLVIIDEAHHARNPRTNRYFALESLVRRAKVLLLSATPIHNRREDLVALLALFLGSRARAMTSAELALCVVRREQRQLEHSLRMPTVLTVVSHELPDDPALVEQLMDLPPPIPLRDGGVGGALIGRGLVHQWASSEAALHEAVRKRIARAGALSASLEAGTYPTTRELETWVYGEGALQLGFAELLSAPIAGHEELLAAIRVHLNALEQIRARFRSSSSIDTERARIVSALRNSRARTRIVAFAQYAETISMLFRLLVRAGRVAMLTSHGARVAGGSLTRMEAIGRFAPRATGCAEPTPVEAIDLLLTTDLLSEGVNLQDANLVVHLDIPWTVARMEQRVGRVARLGSPHAEVGVHVLRPPPSAVVILGSESILHRKWRVAKSAVGTSARDPVFDAMIRAAVPERDLSDESAPSRVEQLRVILERWSTVPEVDCSQPDNPSESTLVATVNAPEQGFVAAVSTDGPHLLVGLADRVTTDLATQIDTCANVGAIEMPTEPAEAERVLEMIDEWFTSEKASAAAGLGASGALRRKEITQRIDALIESAPPHLRTSRLAAAARARTVATTPQCAAIEHHLDTLLRSELSPDDWLHAIADLERNAGRRKKISTDPPRIHAILILHNRT